MKTRICQIATTVVLQGTDQSRVINKHAQLEAIIQNLVTKVQSLITPSELEGSSVDARQKGSRYIGKTSR